MWKKIRETAKNLWQPSVDEESLKEKMEELRTAFPTPVLWLFGKTQAGKTSIIHAITKDPRAEIGTGFKPCTRFSQLYTYGSEENPVLYFLDTRGLGEVAYDPAEDMQACAAQAHCVMVVVKAMDQALECLIEPLAEIRRQHPDWKFLVVQTCLHEGYPVDFRDHVMPYPYENPEDARIPDGLRRSLAAQRERFAFLDALFVPVDFTLPEDGFSEPDYGLEPLWNVIDAEVLPGLRTALVAADFEDIYHHAAMQQVLSYAVFAGSAALTPVPFVAAPVILAIQAKMFHSVASVYGQPMTKARIAELAGMFGVSYLSRMAGRELLKFIPLFGSAAAAAYVAGTTYAIGFTLCAYFSKLRAGELPDKDSLRELYASQVEKGKEMLGKYMEEMGRKKGDG